MDERRPVVQGAVFVIAPGNALSQLWHRKSRLFRLEQATTSAVANWSRRRGGLMPESSPRAQVSNRPSSGHLNALLNVFWSFLGFAPVFAFSYQFMTKPWIYGSAAAGLIAYAIPTAWLYHLQLSSRTVPYRYLRVHLLVRVTQDGGSIAAPRHNLAQTAWFRDREALNRMVQITVGRERFHLAMFISFLLATGSAILNGHLRWSFLLCLSNTIYNVYPILLQQYIRIRLQNCVTRSRRLQENRLAFP